MACWTDEIQTGVNACIMVSRQHPLNLQFFLKVRLELLINIIDNSFEAEMKTNSSLPIHYNNQCLVESVFHTCLLCLSDRHTQQCPLWSI